MNQSPTNALNAKPPVRCLIIQMARLGDTLQSLMALRAAKQLYPELEIHFLAREKFSCAAKRVPWIHKVITFPTETLLGPILLAQKTETQGLGDLAQWIAPLMKDSWDMVVNWTYSESSSYLTGLIPAKVKLGYTRRLDSTFAGADGWSHFIQAIVQGRINQNIHLTDVLTTQLLTALQIHQGEPHGDSNSAVTSKSFFSLTLNESELKVTSALNNGRWIAIQLGASRKSKTWDSASWTKLIKYILENNPDYGVVLLGGKEDNAGAQEIIKQFSDVSDETSPGHPKVISKVGETSFDLWTSIVSRSQWLIAGDTAAIHLASVLGVRVLNISIGPVRYFETGPYGNGHYVVTAEKPCLACEQNTTHPTCGTAISPEAVYGVWSYAISEWTHRKGSSLENHFFQLGWSDSLTSTRVLKTRIRAAIDGGGVVYDALIKRALRIEEWTGMVMGHLARAWYCGWLPPIGQELSRETMSPSLIQKLREMTESTQVLSKICQQASQTAEFLNQKSLTLKSEKIMNLQDRAELQRLGKDLLELEELIERITKTHPALGGFSQMSKVLMHHLQGTQLAELGKQTAECYKQINEGVLIFRQWIQSTLALVKPVAVKAANPSVRPAPNQEPTL